MSVDVKQIIIENKEKVSYYIKKMNELEQKDKELKLQILMHNFQKEEKYRKEKDEKNDREKKHIERMNRFTIEQQKKKEESKEKKCNKDKIEKETLKERQKSVSCYKKYDDKKIDEFIFKNEKFRDDNTNNKDPYYSRLKDEINKDLNKKKNMEKTRSSIINKEDDKNSIQQYQNLIDGQNINSMSSNDNQDFYNNASLETPMNFINIMENKKSIKDSVSKNNTSININNNKNNDLVINESKNAPSGSEEEFNSEAQFLPDNINKINMEQYKTINRNDNNNHNHHDKYNNSDNHDDNIYKERRMSDSSNYIVSSKKNLLTSNNAEKEVKKKSKVKNLKNSKTKNKVKSKNKLNSNNIINIKKNKSNKLKKSKIPIITDKSKYKFSQVNKIAKSKQKKPLNTNTESNNISAKAVKPKIPISNSSKINKKSEKIHLKTTEQLSIKKDSITDDINKKKIKKDTKSSKSVSKLINNNKSIINNSIKIANKKKCHNTNSNFIRLIKDNEREKEFLGYNFNTSFARDKDYVKAFSKSISSFNSKAVYDSQSKRKYRDLRHDGLNLKMRIYNGKADPVTLYKDFKDEWKRLKFLNIRKKMKIIDKNDSVAKNTLLLKIKKMLKPIHLVKGKGSIEFTKENSQTNYAINNRIVNNSLIQSYNYNSQNKIEMSNLNNEIDNDYYNKENYNEEYEDNNIPIDINIYNNENNQENSGNKAILYNDEDNENDINYDLSNINDELETKMKKTLI